MNKVFFVLVSFVFIFHSSLRPYHEGKELIYIDLTLREKAMETVLNFIFVKDLYKFS